MYFHFWLVYALCPLCVTAAAAGLLAYCGTVERLQKFVLKQLTVFTK